MVNIEACVCVRVCVCVISGLCKVVIDNEVQPTAAAAASGAGAGIHRRRTTAALKSRHELCIVTRNEIIGNKQLSK